MSSLSTLGILHTLVSICALGAGVAALLRGGRIALADSLGRSYAWLTALSAASGLFIFAHGGFGIAHVLALLTLLTLLVALLARRSRLFGRAALATETVALSATLLFHMIPGITETTTRLPAGAPLFASAEEPALQAIIGALALLFLAGAAWQVRALRRAA